MSIEQNEAVFARRVFIGAGIYGLVVLLPMYFLEGWVGQEMPPAISHPEFYYGFLGTAVAWQLAFLVLGRDPVRYRLFMLPAMIEKFSYGLAVIVLMAQGRLAATMLVTGVIDLGLGVLFVIAWRRTAPH